MPLAFDLDLDALQTYRGSSPRPDDFDEFWDRSLAELGTTFDVEITDAEFQAPFATCSHLWFTGTGGAGSRVHAKLIRPKTDHPGPAVVVFHGYTMSSDDWTGLLPLAAAGMTVAALDVRGQGGSSDDLDRYTGMTAFSHMVRGLADALAGHPERLFFRNVFLDAVALTRIVAGLPEVDENRIAAQGRSQGGALATAAAALEQRVSRTYAIYPFLADYRRVWSMSLDSDPYIEIREWFRRHDPRHAQEDAVFNALGYIDVANLAPRIRGHYTMPIGFEDQVCPPSTQFAIYNNVAGSKQLWTYPDFGHDPLPGVEDAIFTDLLAAWD